MVKVLASVAVILFATAASAAEKDKTATAQLKDASGKIVGTATFKEKKDGVEVKVDVAGLTPGKHGIHLHEKGKCDPPGFKSAGDHFNPTQKHHGAENPKGKHAGDLPNLDVKGDGTAKMTATAEGATLGEGAASLLKDGGTALIIHEGPDDEKSDPAGQSGDRIACGVVTSK